MTRRGHTVSKPLRPQRRRVFIGCEGASEGGYAAWLQSLFDARALPVALDIVVLGPGVGDPHEIVRKAISKADTSAKRKGPHAARYVLLDTDRHEATIDLGRRTLDLARKHGIALIWQRPCHEALLLRHLPGCSDRRPATAADALPSLLRSWPFCGKPMSSRELAMMIDEAAVMRAVEVEPELCDFLVAIGLAQARRKEKGRRT